MKTISNLLAATALTAVATTGVMAASHAQKWDMPMAYAASQFPLRGRRRVRRSA